MKIEAFHLEKTRSRRVFFLQPSFSLNKNILVKPKTDNFCQYFDTLRQYYLPWKIK